MYIYECNGITCSIMMNVDRDDDDVSKLSLCTQCTLIVCAFICLNSIKTMFILKYIINPVIKLF